MQRTYQFASIGPTHADPAIMELLISVGRRQSYAKGNTIVQRGDPANGFWLIVQGQVTVCRFGAEGEVSVFAVLGAGDLFGDLACLSGMDRQVDAFAEQDAELIWIENARLETLLATEPRFARWLLASLATQLSTALNRIETHMSLPAHARLAGLLIESLERDGPVIQTTQQELADFIGVSRITVGQLLKYWRTLGVLTTGYRAVTILRPEQLKILAAKR